MSPKFGGQVRHILTGAGGLLVARGAITADQAEQIIAHWEFIVGAISYVLGAIASWRAPEKE